MHLLWEDELSVTVEPWLLLYRSWESRWIGHRVPLEPAPMLLQCDISVAWLHGFRDILGSPESRGGGQGRQWKLRRSNKRDTWTELGADGLHCLSRLLFEVPVNVTSERY